MSSSWVRGLSIVKMSILPKLMYIVLAIPIKIKVFIFFKEIDYSKRSLKCKGLSLQKATLKRKKLEDKHYLISKLKSIVIKALWYWDEGRNVYQRNKIKILEIDPHIYGQLIFNKATKAIQQKKEYFQQMVLGQVDSHMHINCDR